MPSPEDDRELKDEAGERVPSQAAATTRSTIWLIAAQASSLIIGFAVWAYAARVLRPEQFGEVQLGIAVGTYLALLATVGLNPLAIAEFASKRRPAAYVLRLQSIRVAHTVVALAGLVVVGLLTSSHIVSALLALCASAVVLRQLWPEWVDIALEASWRVALIRTVYYVSVLLGTLLLVRHAGNATEFGLVLSLGTIVAAVPAWCLTARHLRRLVSHPALAAARPVSNWGSGWRQIMRRALPLGAGDVLGQLLANADVLLLGALASKESVALYGAAYRIILAVQGVGVALRYASLRVLASPGTRDSGKTSKFEDDLVLLTVLGAVVIAAVAALAAPMAISLSYGSKYAGSVGLLQILVWTWPLDFSSAVVLNMLIVRARRRRYVAAMSFAAAVNLAANAVVIPRFGASGAAVVIVVSLAVLLLGALWMMDVSYLVERRRGFWLPLALVAAGLAGSLLVGRSYEVLGTCLLSAVAALATFKLLQLLKPTVMKGVRPSVASS
jgi:O-antigen/teichoic acid export membrane protein